MIEKESPSHAQRLREQLESAKFLQPSAPKKYPRIALSVVAPKLTDFLQIVQRSLDS